MSISSSPLTSVPSTLGIELGSTRIKAVLIDSDHRVIASGSSSWENSLLDGIWTYSLEEVWNGLRAAVAALLRDAAQCGVLPRVEALGISAMMHGYLTFDGNDNQLVPFRTWRNTNTGPAVDSLSTLLNFNVPHRWSIAHVYQALIDAEPHASEVSFVTTLAGYVHWILTGRKVLGIGDASGMFPIDPIIHDWDSERLEAFDQILAVHRPGVSIRTLLPDVLVAGEDAGALTGEGAALLDPSGTLTAGIRLCAPEGDAGTGMVATNSVRPRTGNVSAGTSIFAMVVLEEPLSRVHSEIDIVTTPSGDLVAMVHCNNGASELDAWVGTYHELLAASGIDLPIDQVFTAFFHAALGNR